MNDRKMFTMLPTWACPNCNNGKFDIIESQIDNYITNRNGSIVSHMEMSYACIGRCLICKRVYDMVPTATGFVPVSKDYEAFIDNANIDLFDIPEESQLIPNPMEVDE